MRRHHRAAHWLRTAAVARLGVSHGCGLLLALLLAAACGKDGASEAPPPPKPVAPAQGAPAIVPGPAAKATAVQLFTQRCVPCHGTVGAGDGPASATLDPKPRAFGDPTWQATVTDDQILKIIRYGGAAVGKSAAMPNNPDLNDAEVVAALKDVVRGFKK